MTGLEIHGWVPGFNKVACDKLLKRVLGIGLKQAKDIVDAVLDGEVQVLQLQSKEEAEQLVMDLCRLGAKARVVDKTS
jgi:ribosomal protein L7/L12